MRAIWDRDFARSVDALSQEFGEIDEKTLMTAAGTVSAEIIASQAEIGSSILVLCGPGNNGGDGFVCARLLSARNFKVSCCLIAEDRDKLSSACRREMQEAERLDILRPLAEVELTAELTLVDAILGTGFRGTLRQGSLRTTLEELAKIKFKRVFAIDIPSGLDCNCEQREFLGLTADLTITFGGAKPAHTFYPWRQYCGQLKVVDIGFSRHAISASESRLPLNYQILPSLEPMDAFSKLPIDAHKFERGHILIVGGSKGKLGAPTLAAMAALRAGAGWVSLASPAPHPLAPVELTHEDFFLNAKLDEVAFSRFLDRRKVKTLLLGPGTVDNFITPEIAACLQNFTERGGKLCLDAAATQNLQVVFSNTPLAPGSAIALPHPGEWAKAVDIQFDLSQACKKSWLSVEKKFGIQLVFKSPTPTWLDNETWTLANQGERVLGKAGTGDVLAGLVAAYLTQSSDHALEYALNDLYRAMRAALAIKAEKAILPSDLIASL